MAKDKKSFLLYVDQKSLFDKLPDDIAGKLIKHIFSYVNDEDPKADDILLDIAFEPIKTQLKRDLKKYESICMRNRENAKKRWRATASDRIPKDTKNADKDNDIDNDKEKDNNNILFNLFWDSYHSITGKLKTEKDQSIKYFKRLSKKDKQKAIDNIKPYFDSLNDKKYCKKARTYLSDKNFNDEFRPQRPKITKLAGT